MNGVFFFRVFFLIEIKKLSLWDKIKYLNFNIFGTWCCKPLIFETQIIWSNRIHSLKYLRSATQFPISNHIKSYKIRLFRTSYNQTPIPKWIYKVKQCAAQSRRENTCFPDLFSCWIIMHLCKADGFS